MAGLDEGISNLQKFNGEAAGSASYLLQASARLEAASGAIEQLDQEAQGDIGDTNRILAEAETELVEARAAANTALDTLAQAAEEATDDTLDTKQGELEAAADEAEQAAESARDDLEASYDRLHDDGFRAHENALDDLGTGVEDATGATEQAFEGLTDQAASLSGRAEALRDETTGGLAEAESDVEQAVSALAGRFDAVKEVWHQSIDEGLRASCEEVGADLQRIYGDWSAAVGGVTGELREECSTPFQNTADFLEQQAHQALEQGVGELLRGPADQLLAEERLAAAAAEGASAVAEAVADILADLRVSVNVVDEINRLLDELE